MDVLERIKEQVDGNPVIIFMKGTPQFPMCGFSSRAAAALQDCGEQAGEKPRCIQLRLSDPTAQRFQPLEIDIDLQTGWLGPSDGSQRVQVLERTQPKLANYFATIITVQQQRSDFRDR